MIEYHINHVSFNSNCILSARVAEQWRSIQNELGQLNHLGEVELVRYVLERVDYTASFELPYRLLLTKVPQAITKINREYYKVHVLRVGIYAIYSREPLHQYNFPREIVFNHQIQAQKITSKGHVTDQLLEHVATDKHPRHNLDSALRAGCLVTAVDAMVYFGCQRVASDIEALRKEYDIETLSVKVFDTYTNRTRVVPAYRLPHSKDSFANDVASQSVTIM